MNIKIDSAILCRGHNFMDFTEEMELFNAIKRYYKSSSFDWLMHKAFEFGYVYGLRAERARRKKSEQS